MKAKKYKKRSQVKHVSETPTVVSETETTETKKEELIEDGIELEVLKQTVIHGATEDDLIEEIEEQTAAEKCKADENTDKVNMVDIGLMVNEIKELMVNEMKAEMNNQF